MATVTQINVAPVKALGLVHPDEVRLERTGVAENRRFHIVDSNGRRYNQIRKGTLVQVKPEYDAEREWLALRFPDGSVAEGTVALDGEVTTDFYGRPVTGNYVSGPWSEALSQWFDRELRLIQSPPGAAIDRGRGHVSFVSRASLAELGRHGGQDGPVDGRRFRMLFEVDDCEAHDEDTWVKRQLRIGEALVRIRNDVGRCAITTQNPDTGVPDFNTLKTIAGYRDLTRNEDGKQHIPFGVYGEVLEPGWVRLGDPVDSLD